MSKLSTYKCDSCGKLREKDSNHWLALRVDPGGFFVADRFTEQAADYKHYCGEECGMAAFQRWMQTGKLESASQIPISKCETPI